jgi:phytoene synthase
MSVFSVKADADAPSSFMMRNETDVSLAHAHVRALVEKSKTSFGGGMKILPPERREAMYAIYAFCREVDDIADEPGDVAAKRIALARWREEIERLYQGCPITLTGRALLKPVERFDLPKEEFLALIEGMEMDVEKMIRAPSLAELKHYCRCVAGAVGLLSVRTFGAQGPFVNEYALALGEAFQLTNILRDIAADAALGRVYLPRELLQQHGIVADDPAAVTSHPALPKVCDALAMMAQKKYAESEAIRPDAGSAKSLKPAVVMMAVYRRILGKLMRRGFAAWHEPVGLNVFEKFALALRYGLFSGR